jgi:acyl-coenzyme A thioesterase PaaI-like protein
MSKTSSIKRERHSLLKVKIEENPFLTDEELASLLSVSVPTIRLYRLELGIPELRERIKNVAESNQTQIKTLSGSEIIGELLEFDLGQNAMSVLETTESMVFEKTRIIRGQYIYSMAESLAIAVIDAQVALVGVANVKYKTPVYSGTKLIGKAEVKRSYGNNSIVWVRILEKQKEIFRGKFILVSVE